MCMSLAVKELTSWDWLKVTLEQASFCIVYIGMKTLPIQSNQNRNSVLGNSHSQEQEWRSLNKFSTVFITHLVLILPGARYVTIPNRATYMNSCNFLCQISSSALSKCARDILSNSPWTRTLAQVETVSLRLSMCQVPSPTFAMMWLWPTNQTNAYLPQKALLHSLISCCDVEYDAFSRDMFAKEDRYTHWH